MPPLSNASLIEQLRWRYATKKFDPARKIPADTWATLEQALVLTPSSFGLQPWRFIVITDAALKQKLVPLSWKQTQPAECSHFVVFTARHTLTEKHIDEYLQSIATTRRVTMESLAGYRKMMIGSLVPPTPGFEIKQWASLQVYIALGNFMTSAALLGVDTCPMEGIEPAKYDDLLELSGSGFATVVACAAGYRADDDKCSQIPKVRFPAQQMIDHR